MKWLGPLVGTPVPKKPAKKPIASTKDKRTWKGRRSYWMAWYDANREARNAYNRQQMRDRRARAKERA